MHQVHDPGLPRGRLGGRHVVLEGLQALGAVQAVPDDAHGVRVGGGHRLAPVGVDGAAGGVARLFDHLLLRRTVVADGVRERHWAREALRLEGRDVRLDLGACRRVVHVGQRCVVGGVAPDLVTGRVDVAELAPRHDPVRAHQPAVDVEGRLRAVGGEDGEHRVLADPGVVEGERDDHLVLGRLGSGRGEPDSQADEHQRRDQRRQPSPQRPGAPLNQHLRHHHVPALPQ